MNPARPAEHRVVSVGDALDLHVVIRERPGTRPLLLLHGFTGSAESWTPLCDALAALCTTITVDLPGHGSSSAPGDPARYALPRLADDLSLLLDRLAVRHAAVLGYSMGARAALHLALSHPSRVSALVLESGSPGLSDPAERSARVTGDNALADFIEREGVGAFIERWEALPLWSSQSSLTEDARRSLREQRFRNHPTGLANSLRGAGSAVASSVEGQLAELGMPTLLIAGGLDAKYVALAERMAWLIAGSRILVVPHAGHAVHLEQPAAFAAAVQEFLAEDPR